MKSLLVVVTLAVSVFGAPVTTAVSQSEQGALANGGLVGGAVNAVANAAVTGVKANVENNNIGDGVLNYPNIDILKRTDSAVQGAQEGAASGGVLGVVPNILAGAAVKGVDADVECNDVLDNVANDANIDILRRDTAAAAQGVQQGAAQGGLAGIDVPAIINAAITGATAVVSNNNILDNDLNDLHASILKRQTGVAQGVQQGQASGGLAGLDVNAIVNAVVKGIQAHVSNNNIGDNVGNNATIGVLNSLPIRRSEGPAAVAQGVQGAKSSGAVAGSANVVTNAAAELVKAVVSNNNILDGVANYPTIKVASP